MRRWLFIAVLVAVAIILAIALIIWLLPLWLLITLAILLALFLLFLPIQIAVQTRQHGLEATVWVQLKLPLLTFSKAINITDKVRLALRKTLKQWRKQRRQKGQAASASSSTQRLQALRPQLKRLQLKRPQPKPPQRKRPPPPPPPFRSVMHAVRLPMRYFARHIRFSQVRLRVEVGGFDAMQSALLAGALWSVVGMALGVVGTVIRLDPAVPKIAIVPNFSGPTWRLQADCILRFRLGHAIVAGVWALGRLLREKALVRWWQESRRRKGVEGSGRKSDSGPDEDGHGEHQGHD